MPSQSVVTNSKVGAKFCITFGVCADRPHYCLLNIMFARRCRTSCGGGCGWGGGVIINNIIIVIVGIDSRVIIIVIFNRRGDIVSCAFGHGCININEEVYFNKGGYVVIIYLLLVLNFCFRGRICHLQKLR